MKSLLVTIAVSLLLSGCANGPGMRDADRLALYSANAGAPVDDFHYFGRINGWTPLGDEALALWTRPNQAYLLDLIGSCPDLKYASAIQVSNQFGRVHARFDSVHVLDRNAVDIPCRIEQIRPIDVSALEQDQREMREGVETAERDQNAQDQNAQDQDTQEPDTQEPDTQEPGGT